VTQDNTGKDNNMVGISAHTKSAVHANDFFYSTKLWTVLELLTGIIHG